MSDRKVTVQTAMQAQLDALDALLVELLIATKARNWEAVGIISTSFQRIASVDL